MIENSKNNHSEDNFEKVTDGYDSAYNEQDYLERLWECYEKGVKQEKLPKKELFIELIRDLLKQIREA